MLDKLATALVGAGRGREAAETLVRASRMRSGEAADALRRRAVEQYFRTGLFETGMETMRPLMASVGLRLPESRWATMLLIYWNAILVLFAWRMTSRRDPLAHRRALVCWSMTNIGNYESHRSALFGVMGVRYARRGGDPMLHGRMLTMVAAAFGNRPMAEAVSDLATTWTGNDKHVLEGWTH